MLTGSLVFWKQGRFTVLAILAFVLCGTLSFAGQALGAETSLVKLHTMIEENKADIDRLWVLLAAALVFFMQAGFLCLEVGLVRPRSIVSIAMKNGIDWIMGSFAFLLVGFGLMFGTTWGGMFGSEFSLHNLLTAGDAIPMKYIFFMFQLGFLGTAITIVSGTMSERTGFVTYVCASFLVGLIIYPVFGHWAWGNLFIAGNETFLQKLGFMDFAGSTVVHSVGAWVGLVGIWMLGPRLGRYDSAGKMKPMQGYSIPFAMLGVLILWVGWWGFNGGSTLAFSEEVGSIILNTNMAAAAGGLAAFLHSRFIQKKADLNEKLIGGILGGLVAITAGCNVVTPMGAVMVGLTAGVVHNLGYDFILKKLKLDDPVGAVPIHGICGVWGTLCVALFGRTELFAMGNSRWEQLGVQMIGITTCFVWTALSAYLMFRLLKATVGLRVSPAEERIGINIAGEVEQVPADVGSLDAEALKRLL